MQKRPVDEPFLFEKSRRFLNLSLLYSMRWVLAMGDCGKVVGFALWVVRRLGHDFVKMLLTLCFACDIMLMYT